MNAWDDELCSSCGGFRDWTLETLSPLLDLWEGGADIDPLDRRVAALVRRRFVAGRVPLASILISSLAVRDPGMKWTPLSRPVCPLFSLRPGPSFFPSQAFGTTSK